MAVETRIIKIDLQRMEMSKIRTIAEMLRTGGVIVYPTDTFYGLGVNCYIEKAIEKIYRLKKRDHSKPISLMVSDMEMVEKVAVEIPHLFRAITKEFWPGPLTLVLKASSGIPKELQSSEGSIGFRLPALPWLRELISVAEFPITATSANLSGEKEISSPEEVIKTFHGKVDLIADGGKTLGVLPSTVIDLTAGKPQIVREGAVPSSALKKYLEI